MHGTVSQPLTMDPHGRLFERACPGPVDYPHRARLYLLSFWVQNYWGRWAHPRRCYADLRVNGKVRCKPDSTWETTAAIGLDEVLCRQLDYRLPKTFSKTPVLGFFLLWMLAGIGLGLTWEDSQPEPQRKNIKDYRRGEAPFHHVHVARPDRTGERQLFNLAKSGDIAARNTLIAGHLWLADAVARKLCGDRSDFDDIRQEARLALFKALDDFNHEGDNKFSTFAWVSVRADVVDYLRKERRLGRHPSAELIASRNEAALGLYAHSSVKPRAEYKIFRGLFEKT